MNELTPWALVQALQDLKGVEKIVICDLLHGFVGFDF